MMHHSAYLVDGKRPEIKYMKESLVLIVPVRDLLKACDSP